MTDKAVTVHQDQPQAVQVFNPLDAPVAQFQQSLVDRQQNYDALAMHLRGMLAPGHDFGRIHVANKKKCPSPWSCSYQAAPGHWSNHTLFAAGADKILGMLGLGCQYPGEQDFMRAALTGKPILEVIAKCQVVDSRGQVLAEEMGACARAEVNDSLNNAIKRAAKRARVGAVLRLPSISALFESDFLAEVETAAADKGGNTTASRQRHNAQTHSTGAEIECMPFGKHKNVRFTALPEDYLEWAARECNAADVKAAAIRELERRSSLASGNGSEPPAASQEPQDDLPPVESYEDDGVPFDDEIPF